MIEMQSVKMYCCKCHEDFITEDAQPATIETKRGPRNAVTAVHKSCGTKSYKFVKKDAV